ncbi:hypothetical protein ACFO9Q_18140 [Paenibacillus sp. GCM10023252]|uniref:glycoside hydrolase family 130 protein n=1 Tax=Paenibacillus sp. GCM10023252 TaxID=3252649 RepID=UPI00361ACABF
MDEKYRDTMRKAYQEAIDVPVTQFETLSELSFCTDYGDEPSDWRVGPFKLDESMTFTKTLPFDDPTDIGWKSTILGNPTLIESDGNLHMFYRGYPSKESMCTRIGHAYYNEAEGWVDLSGAPALYSTEEDEVYSVEDPKLYKHEDLYYMFYNSVWIPEREQYEEILDGANDWGVIVVTKLAVSRDLVHFEKRGQVIPYSVSRGWSKGAVIPRNEKGEAVKINGKFMMFISEGCGGKQYIGYSDNLVDWEYKQETYLELPAEMGRVAEVACCAVNIEPTGELFLLDTFYRDTEGEYQACQALYHRDQPTEPIRIEQGGSLAWGGLLKYKGAWIVAQGWDSPKDRQDIYVYRADSEAVQTHGG